MNTPTKLTVARIVFSLVIVFLLLFPFYLIGIDFPTFSVGGVVMDVKMIIAGVLFILASLTDFLDGHLARKNGLVTDTGKMLDAIADKVLVNSVLIVFASLNLIHALIPVVIVLRDIVVNAIKMEAASKGKVVAAIKSGKIKTACLMIGMILVFFYNMPFELINIRIDLFFLYFATIMSIVSGCQYYALNKKIIFPKKENE